MIPRRDLLLGAIASSAVVTQAHADLVPDEEVRTILKDRIDNARQAVGIVRPG